MLGVSFDFFYGNDSTLTSDVHLRIPAYAGK